MLKIWHYLSYIGHFYLYVQWKANAFLGVYRSFCKCQEVLQSCNMLQLGIERCRYVLTIISVKILNKFEETLLTIRHATVSLMFM